MESKWLASGVNATACFQDAWTLLTQLCISNSHSNNQPKSIITRVAPTDGTFTVVTPRDPINVRESVKERVGGVGGHPAYAF